MASLLDWFGGLGKKVEGAFAQVNPFDGGADYNSVVNGQRPQQTPEQPRQPRLRPMNNGLESLNAPLTDLRPKINVNANAELSKKQTQDVNPLTKTVGDIGKGIGEFTAGANEAFLGGAQKLAVNAFNQVATGFNQDEAEKRTNDFLRSTGQTNERNIPQLSVGYNRDSTPFKAGQVTGTGEKVLTDLATTALPGMAAEKALRGLPVIARGLGSANLGNRILSGASSAVGGGLVSSAVSQLKRPEQNVGENFGQNAALDVATAALPGALSVLGRTFVPRVPNVTAVARSLDTPAFVATPRQIEELPLPRSQQTVPQQPLQPRRAPTSAQTDSIDSIGRTQSQNRLPVSQLPQPSTQTYKDTIPQLPQFGVKSTKLRDKAFRSTRSIIERQGQSGRQLAGMLQGARDTQEIYLGQLQKAMPTVTKLANPRAIGKDSWNNKSFENFIDAVEGTAPPANAQVARAVEEWKQAAPQIRQRAVDAGLDVGDLGPSYYPHFVDYDRVFKDKNMYNQALDHLVKSGQAKTHEEAIQLLNYAKDTSRNRSFGNLEASRLVDLPFYDKTPNSLISYLNSSAKRIANTETFGAKDENALKLLAGVAREGGDAESAKNAFDIAVGARRYNPSSEKISGGIRKYVTTTRLGLGALTNVSQNVNTGIVTGHLRTLGAMAKQLDPKQREFVADTGVISDALLNDLKTQSGYSSFASKVFGKAVSKVTAPFFGSVEKFNRGVAATAGRDYALRLAQKGDERTLRKLGVTGPIRDQTLTEAQQVQAARKVVEKTQFKVDPQDLPGWTDSPGGKLVSQFRTFSYNQGKFFSNEILKPAAKGNVLPLTRLLAAIPLGYALYKTRAAITNQSPEEDQAKVALQSFGKVGGAGLALDIYNGLNPIGSKYLPSDRRVTMAVGALGGPAAGLGAQVVAAGSEAIQNKNIPTDESRLEGKVALRSNDKETYKDLTPAARLGVSQIPVVGTRLQNSLLPYKKESDSDSGNVDSIEAGKTSPAQAVKYLNKTERKALGDLQKSVGKDTYALSTLSNSEKDTLVSKGITTRDQIDAAEETVKQKRLEMGLDKPVKEETYKDRFNEAKKEFQKKNKSWSAVERAGKAKELRSLSVKKDFNNDTIDLYGMNKADVYDLVSGDKNGKKLLESIVKYGDAQVAAGLIKQNKFRDKNGNISLYSGKSSKKGGRKKSSGIDIASIRKLANSAKVPTYQQPPSNGNSPVAAPGYRKTTLKRYSRKK